MKLAGFILVGVVCTSTLALAQETPTTIQADVIIDGKGGTVRNANIVIQGTKIASVGATAPRGTVYDLRGLTVMPGWIDTHADISGHFDRKTGRLPERNSETPQQAMLYTEGNALPHVARRLHDGPESGRSNRQGPARLDRGRYRSRTENPDLPSGDHRPDRHS